MKDETMKGGKKRGRHHGERYRGMDKSQQGGPKTFRRGRAIAFLEMLYLKRSTIKQQLDKPEFQSIQPILVGELKAMDTVINEFIQLFDIHESEAMEQRKENVETESTVQNADKSFDNKVKGTYSYETD